jgi:hypothetical protein
MPNVRREIIIFSESVAGSESNVLKNFPEIDVVDQPTTNLEEVRMLNQSMVEHAIPHEPNLSVNNHCDRSQSTAEIEM